MWFLERLLDSAWGKINHWTQADWDNFKENGDQFYTKMAESIASGLNPTDQSVHDLVHQHYLLISPLWSFDQASYTQLADSYLQDQNFMQLCELYHPKLRQFIVEAMQYYAKYHLS